MKTLPCILSLLAIFALTPATFAQAKKKADAKPAEAAAPADPTAKAAPAKAGTEAKPKVAKAYPFNLTADEIDAAGKSFTHNNQDGKKVKNVLGEKAEVMQGTTAAKFEDIKVGDTVSGLRVKKNEEGTEYEVTKITKFGVTPVKAEPKKKK